MRECGRVDGRAVDDGTIQADGLELSERFVISTKLASVTRSGTHKVILVPDTFMEERLFDAERRSMEGVIDNPKCDSGRITDPRCAVARNAIRFAATIL